MQCGMCGARILSLSDSPSAASQAGGANVERGSVLVGSAKGENGSNGLADRSVGWIQQPHPETCWEKHAGSSVAASLARVWQHALRVSVSLGRVEQRGQSSLSGEHAPQRAGSGSSIANAVTGTITRRAPAANCGTELVMSPFFRACGRGQAEWVGN
jgi:hypothetical protein